MLNDFEIKKLTSGNFYFKEKCYSLSSNMTFIVSQNDNILEAGRFEIYPESDTYILKLYATDESDEIKFLFIQGFVLMETAENDTFRKMR